MKTFVKVLIWIGAFVGYFVAGFILDIIFMEMFRGIRPGFLFDVALICVMGYLGKKLSERWEMHCIEKEALREGKSRKEYLIERTPKFIIDVCEGQHTAAAIQEMLKPHIKERLITSAIAKALSEEFGRS